MQALSYTSNNIVSPFILPLLQVRQTSSHHHQDEQDRERPHGQGPQAAPTILAGDQVQWAGLLLRQHRTRPGDLCGHRGHCQGQDGMSSLHHAVNAGQKLIIIAEAIPEEPRGRP